MSAIVVENLSKRFLIDHRAKHDTLRDSLAHGARSLLASLRGAQRVDREEFWALRDVSFAIQPGEVVGIIGRNGAGKSTLLKILSRITEPTTGRITLNGRIASLLEVGTGFHPELSGRENIFLNGAILGMGRAEILRKFDEIVAFAEVERFLDTPVKRYSSGMYVRLAFAVAAHLEPEILIVDEVLAVGDAAFQKKCLGKMNEVAGGGRTVLFVSHNLSAVLGLCSRGILLQSGRMIADGPVEQVANRYMQQGGPAAGRYTRPADAPPLPAAILGVELLNSERRPTSTVDNGRPMYVSIDYKLADGFSAGINPSVAVHTPLGVPIFQHHARLNKQVFQDPPREGRITFALPKLPLPAGGYHLSACFVTPDEKIVDHVENAFLFEVVEGGFYAPSESTPSSHGLVLVEGDWSVEALPPRVS